MSMPDFVGYSLGDALCIIEEMGLKIDTIKISSEPKQKLSEYDNSFKIIRCEIMDTSVKLLICKPL